MTKKPTRDQVEREYKLLETTRINKSNQIMTLQNELHHISKRMDELFKLWVNNNWDR